MNGRVRQIAATTLAVVFGVVAGIDIVGTPLAIVAINNAGTASDHAAAASHKAEQVGGRADLFAQALGAAVVRSRLEDCRQQEKLREISRRRLKQKEREAGVDLRLLHIQETPQIRVLLRKGFAEERQLLSPVDCVAYSRKALP